MAGSSQDGRSRLSAQERRARIVEAAVRLFAKRGFRGATTRELAAAAGVTEPVIYEHFKTKRALYAAIIEAKSQDGRARLAARLGPLVDSSDDRAFFTALAETILSFHERNPEYVRLLLYSGLEGHEMADVFYERHRRHFHRIVAGYIARRVREGAWRPVDPLLAARVFTGMVGNYALARLLFRCGALKISRARLVDGMVAIFLEGVSQPLCHPD